MATRRRLYPQRFAYPLLPLATALVLGAVGNGCLLDVDFERVDELDTSPCTTVGEPLAAGPSCGAGLQVCGVSGDQDCCARQWLPCGTFKRGHDGVNYIDDNHPATISSVWMDRYEVTVGRFRAFLASPDARVTQDSVPLNGVGAHPNNALSGWRSSYESDLEIDLAHMRMALDCTAQGSWTDVPGANENLPITCVTWAEAVLFCAWDGGRLPSEAEFHYAASGGAEQRVYPWSVPATQNQLDGTLAVIAASSSSPVGSLPAGAGRWGHLDLTGNVYEWLLDSTVWQDDGTGDSYLNPCVDCVDTEKDELRRASRGGSYLNSLATYPEDLRSAKAGSALVTERFPGKGFRCVRDLPR